MYLCRWQPTQPEHNDKSVSSSPDRFCPIMATTTPSLGRTAISAHGTWRMQDCKITRSVRSTIGQPCGTSANISCIHICSLYPLNYKQIQRVNEVVQNDVQGKIETGNEWTEQIYTNNGGVVLGQTGWWYALLKPNGFSLRSTVHFEGESLEMGLFMVHYRLFNWSHR